jgi:hypothetical protein
MSVSRSYVSRLFTKPLWWWETKRPYPIVRRIRYMEPLGVSGSANCRLGVLTTPDRLLEAAWSGYSVLKQLPVGVEFIIVVDQVGPVERTQWLHTLFPGVKLVSTGELVKRAQGRLPQVCRLAALHPLGRKLVMILELQRETSLLYSDSDVLAFQAMNQIAEAVANPSKTAPLYLQDIGNVQLDHAAKERVDALGFAVAPTLNSGFLMLPKGCLSPDVAEKILVAIHDITSWFTETTVIAAMVHEAGGIPLSRNEFVVSVQRQFNGEPDVDYHQIALRHFISPVRHLMYRHGMPHLLRAWLSVDC